MEYIPGWGDVLRANLPQLGSAIMDIVMPHKKAQLALQAEIQKDPTLVGKLATIAKDNPGALSHVFGQDTEGFFSSLNETPEAQLARTTTQAASDVAKGRSAEVGAAKLGIADPTTAERARIHLDRERQVALFLANAPPELLRDANFKDVFGLTEDQFNQAQARAQNYKEGLPLKGLSPKEIVQGWKSGKYSNAQIQGWIDQFPDVSKVPLGDEAFQREAALRRDLAAEARRNNRFDLMQQLFMNTAKDAAKMHVNPGALFEAQYGFAAPDVVSGLSAAYGNDDIKTAKEALQREENQERAKLLTPVLKSLDALTKKRTSGTIAAFNAAAQAADIDLRAEEQDRLGPNKTVFYWNGTEVKAEDLPTILDPSRTPSGTNKEEPVTVSPPAASSRTAASVNALRTVAKYKTLPELVQSPEYAKLSDSEKQQASQALATGSGINNTKLKTPLAQFDQTQFDDADNGLKFMKAIVDRNLSKEQVTGSQSFQKLSKKDQQIILDNLEF